MSANANKALVHRFYAEVWNSWDEAAAREILTEDIEFRGSIGLSKSGHAGFIDYMGVIRRAFPDFQNAVEEVIAEGDRAAARLTYTGTHRGPLLGVAATNRRISYAGVALFTFRVQRIAKIWVLGDALSLMRQIGAVPA